MTAFQNAAGVGQAAKRQDMPTMAMEHSMRIFYHIPRKHARPTAKFHIYWTPLDMIFPTLNIVTPKSP
jgi:hypothetical protein